MQIFHPSIEGAQHGPKGLDGFVRFAKESGASGCQPTNFMLENGQGGFLEAVEIQNIFGQHGMLLDGVSAHCPFWVHTTAWTGSKSIRPFIPFDIATLSTPAIESWAENYILKLFDLCCELGVKIIPMFWGVAFGWEVASGYPWGFWEGPGFNFLGEGADRFYEKTETIRQAANSAGIYLAHEIHPGTAASCSQDFNWLVDICDGDECLAVNADPSHCWEGEGWEARFLAVADRVMGVHVKNHVIRPGLPLRSANPNWKGRAMQFTDLPTGDINLVRFVELMAQIGYPGRYCEVMGRDTAPLVTEAESAHRNLDATAAQAIAYTRDNLCFPFATQSFEKGMGTEK